MKSMKKRAPKSEAQRVGSPKHSPLPWSVDDQALISDAEAEHVADVSHDCCFPDDIDQANAELIVRAVNCHAEMIEALENAAECLEMCAGWADDPPGIESLAGYLAALAAKAKGGAS